MTDETDTLRRIIEDCVDSELRWRDQKGRNPRDVAYDIAREIIRSMDGAGIKAVSGT